MNIAICDDNFIARNTLKNMLDDYFSDKSLSVRIDQYCNGVDLIYEVEDGRVYDVIFLDVVMESTSGIATAKQLRGLGCDSEIIIQSFSPAFAVESYEVNAIGYLLKPTDRRKLCRIIDGIIRNIGVSTYHIKYRNSFIMIPFDEIIYVESCNSKCILHRSGGESYCIYKKLCEIEQELNDERFLRSHQSYIVNMDYIIGVNSQFELSTGESALIRQKDLKSIRSEYLEYSKRHSHTVTMSIEK